MVEHIDIRPISQKEIPLILQLLEEFYTELGEEKASLGFLNEQLIQSILGTNKTQIIVGTIADETAGFFSLTWTQAIYAGGNYGVIDEMYVVPKWRSKKIGQLFIKRAINIGRHSGWKRIDVTAPTEKKWQRTIKFYESNGFVFTGPKLKYTF